jgi:hypothetical protein
MLTITAMNLVAENEAEQISFLGDVEGKRREKLERIEKTVDTIRNRFGKKAISFGAEAESDIGVSEHND